MANSIETRLDTKL